MTQATDADGYSLAFGYDAADRVSSAQDKDGHSVSSARDIDGQPRSVTDPNGNSTAYSYWDASRDGRLKQTIDAANHATTLDYDVNGNVTSVTDNLGRVTLTQYDELNRPVRIVGPQYTDAALGNIRPVTTFTYDSLGNRTQVAARYTTDSTGTNPASDVLINVQLTTVYDDFGRKLKDTDALAKSGYQYDVNNNVIQAIDRKNQTTTLTWDAEHQLKTVKDASNQITTYTRNGLGQVTQVQAPQVVYGYQYDAG